ncbi:putative uncharacterized protein [Clostridium sp. CAG:1013]|nr:putative uncharacterized protein [Clostridium sp. CAG:1013]
MKLKVRSPMNLVMGIFMAVMCSVCLVAYFVKDQDIRLLAAGFIVLVWAVTEFYEAFHKGPIEERVSGQADERDIYLAMKSSRTAMSIFNKVLLLVSIVSFWVYSRFDVEFLLPMAVTLCGVELFLFLLLLCVNIYYEKRG